MKHTYGFGESRLMFFGSFEKGPQQTEPAKEASDKKGDSEPQKESREQGTLKDPMTAFQEFFGNAEGIMPDLKDYFPEEKGTDRFNQDMKMEKNMFKMIFSMLSAVLSELSKAGVKINMSGIRKSVNKKDLKKLEKAERAAEQTVDAETLRKIMEKLDENGDEEYELRAAKIANKSPDGRSVYLGAESKLQRETADDNGAREAKLDRELKGDGMTVDALKEKKQSEIEELSGKMEQTKDPDTKETLRRQKVDLERDVKYLDVMAAKREAAADALTNYLHSSLETITTPENPNETPTTVRKSLQELIVENELSDKEEEKIKSHANSGYTDKKGHTWKHLSYDRNAEHWIWEHTKTLDEMKQDKVRAEEQKKNVQETFGNTRFEVQDDLSIALVGINGEVLEKMGKGTKGKKIHASKFTDIAGSGKEQMETGIDINRDGIIIRMPGKSRLSNLNLKTNNLEQVMLTKNKNGLYILSSRNVRYRDENVGYGTMLESSSIYGADTN